MGWIIRRSFTQRVKNLGGVDFAAQSCSGRFLRRAARLTQPNQTFREMLSTDRGRSLANVTGSSEVGCAMADRSRITVVMISYSVTLIARHGHSIGCSAAVSRSTLAASHRKGFCSRVIYAAPVAATASCTHAASSQCSGALLCEPFGVTVAHAGYRLHLEAIRDSHRTRFADSRSGLC